MAISFQAQLVALYNAKNPTLPTPLAVADVDFSAVSVGAGEKNSELTITAKAESVNFENAKLLTYTRLALALGAIAVEDEEENWDTAPEVLAKFNAAVQASNVKFADDEFVVGEITIDRQPNADDAEKTDITVTVNAGHLKFLPGVAVVWTISQPIQKTDLAGTDGDLDGFTA